MSYDPKSDLVALQARGVIESFSETSDLAYGVTVGEDGSIDELIESLPAETEFDESQEYDIVVVGNSDIGIVRT